MVSGSVVWVGGRWTESGRLGSEKQKGRRVIPAAFRSPSLRLSGAQGEGSFRRRVALEAVAKSFITMGVMDRDVACGHGYDTQPA
jgi:hypothetical protein